MKERICAVTGKACAANCNNEPCFIKEQSDVISSRAVLLIQEQATDVTRPSVERVKPGQRGEVYSAIVNRSKQKVARQ
jgi:hypothetical protein